MLAPVIDRRRALLSLAGAVLASAAPRAAFAAGAAKRVGVIGVAGGGTYTDWKERFPKEFAALGWTEGRNLELVWFDVPSADTAAELRQLGRKRAAEMAAAGLDCLVANGEPHARMLLEATRTVPIVADVPDPVANGLVKNLARPGGNMTGLHGGQEEIAIKTVEFLRRLVPGTSCIAWIGPENFARGAVSLENAARSVGLRYRTIPVRSDDEREVARMREEMATLRRQGCTAGVVMPISTPMFEAAGAAAIEHRLALASYGRPEGYLLSYSAHRTPEERSERRVPAIVSRILRGEKPSEIPWEGPNRYRLAINLKTAAKLGIKVPADVLTLADQIVR